MNSPAPKGLRAAWPPEPEGHGSIGPRWDAAGSSTAASTKEPQRLGLATALHAEWTKLRTLAGTYWLLAAAVALTVTRIMPVLYSPQITAVARMAMTAWPS